MLVASRRSSRKWRLIAWLTLISGVSAITVVLVSHSLLPVWGGILLIVVSLGVGHCWMYKPGGVPALIYHSVSDSSAWLPWRSEISVRPATFALHLETIKKMGCNVLTTEQFVRYRKNRIPIPPQTMMIHLDDGYLDNWTAAFPLLKQYGLSATLFVSTDFIEEGDDLRPQMTQLNETENDSLQWQGYINWRELAVMEQSGIISVQAHGTDHARGEIDTKAIDSLSSDNWRKLIWKQWQAMPGNKCDWHKLKAPPHFPLGTRLGNHIPALSGPVLDQNGQMESLDAYKNRIRQTFQRCRNEIGTRLNKDVSIFCWPHNVFSETAHTVAIESGFIATTSGVGENRPDEDCERISRVHIHENAVGWYWPWAEALYLRATIRLFQGNYYWYWVVMVLSAARKSVAAISKRMVL